MSLLAASGIGGRDGRGGAGEGNGGGDGGGNGGGDDAGWTRAPAGSEYERPM